MGNLVCFIRLNYPSVRQSEGLSHRNLLTNVRWVNSSEEPQANAAGMQVRNHLLTSILGALRGRDKFRATMRVSFLLCFPKNQTLQHC